MKKYLKNLIILSAFLLFVLSFGSAKAQNLYSTNGAFPNATSVVLSASINPNGNPTTGWFQISTNPSMNYPTETNHLYVGSSRSETPFTDTINGLSPNTIYYYRAMANNGYTTTKGNILSFSTKSYDNVSTNYINNNVNTNTYSGATVYTNNNAYVYNGTTEIVNITATGAILNAVFTNPNGSPAQGFFEWGTTTAYGNTTNTTDLGTNYSAPFSGTLSGLTPNTKYYFRAVVFQNGHTYRGVTKSFVTYSSTAVNTQTVNPNYQIQNPVIITEEPNTVSTLKVIDGNNLSANAFFGLNFLPTNLFGWLVLLLIILGIVWALRKLSEPTYIVQKQNH